MQSLPSPIIVQGRVIRALVFREAKSRWGRHFLGFIGQCASLGLYAAFFILVRRAASPSVHRGMELVPFIVTGVLLFWSFRSGVSQVQGAASSNRGLLSFPAVTPLDAAVARWILEAGAFLVISIISIIIMTYFNWAQWPRDFLVFLGIIILASFFGFSWGLIFGSLIIFFPPIRIFSNIVMRFMIFVSGVFFVMPEAPAALRDYLIYNPVIHIMEFGREAFFRVYTTDYADANYLGTWIVLSLIAGLILERASRRSLGWLPS